MTRLPHACRFIKVHGFKWQLVVKFWYNGKDSCFPFRITILAKHFVLSYSIGVVSIHGNHIYMYVAKMFFVSMILVGFYQRLVLAFGYCRCLRLSVSPSVTKFVREITHHPFKLGSPNFDHRCKRPLLASLLFWGVIDFDLQGQI